MHFLGFTALFPRSARRFSSEHAVLYALISISAVAEQVHADVFILYTSSHSDFQNQLRKLRERKVCVPSQPSLELAKHNLNRVKLRTVGR
ncbi:hypothetical protein PF006_g31932 [Phytophthora fragariae]|uniref:Uncharacterized protein n=1 Tax=Phytophthora fragariae TaxID=53985 RepID=A0A6A3PF68_9STRA|nr:hypothetical protein PF006_g31932 [Phytophthora fragariae]